MDNKAALDALYRLKEARSKNWKYQDMSVDENIIEQALTTPPAPTVMGDDVREAINAVQFAIDISKNPRLSDEQIALWSAGTSQKPRLTIAVLKTLIRAATQPPQVTDAQIQAALDAVSEWQIARATGCPDIEHEKAASMLKLVKSALQSPAVPREVVEKLREAQTINIHQAAKMVTGQELPCYDPDIYKRRVPKWFLSVIEKLHERMNWNGRELKKSADLIREALALLGGKEG